MNAQVLANGARGGHPRTVPYSKMSPKGRIELRISQSRAKFDQEVAGDVRFCVAPQKTGENIKKPIFFPQIFSRKFRKKKFFWCQFFFDWESFETRFGKVLVEKLRENCAKTRENFANFRENSRSACFSIWCMFYQRLALAFLAEVPPD